MIYTLILINYRKFRFKIIVFASGVHLNIFIESHYMDQSAIIFLTNSDYLANAGLRTVIWKLRPRKRVSINDSDTLKWLICLGYSNSQIPNTTIDIFMF